MDLLSGVGEGLKNVQKATQKKGIFAAWAVDLLRGESSRGQKGPFSPTLCLFSVI
jgi:hypothetical protein